MSLFSRKPKNRRRRVRSKKPVDAWDLPDLKKAKPKKKAKGDDLVGQVYQLNAQIGAIENFLAKKNAVRNYSEQLKREGMIPPPTAPRCAAPERSPPSPSPNAAATTPSAAATASFPLPLLPRLRPRVVADLFGVLRTGVEALKERGPARFGDSTNSASDGGLDPGFCEMPQGSRGTPYSTSASSRTPFFTSNSRHQPLISRSLKILPMTRRRRPLRLAFSRSARARTAASL